MTTTKLEKGIMSFDIGELIECLDLESKQRFIESLACDGEIIKHIIAQVIDGCTENGYYSSMCVTASPGPALGLDWARRQIALRSSEVAEAEIKRLQEALISANKALHETNEKNASLRHQLSNYL